MDISASEITSRKVRGNKVYFSTNEITSKKVLGNNVAFLTIEITSKKVRGNDAEICRNLPFDVKTIQRGVPVGYSQLDFAVRWVLLHLCSGRAACPIY